MKRHKLQVSDLLDAFSSSRLTGIAPALTPDYVMIDPSYITKIPQITGLGCGDLGILTADRQLGIPNNIPPDFNPRPGTNPSPTQ
jgi:hypothetical protein